jgi:ribosomal protein L15E
VKKPVWKTKDPTKTDKKLTPAQKSSAKAAAKKAGRTYPNLVDNMRAARKKK